MRENLGLLRFDTIFTLSEENNLYLCTQNKNLMPATLTRPKTATRKPAVAQGLKREPQKKTATTSKKKQTEDVSWEELQDITKKLIKEGTLKPFEKKY